MTTELELLDWKRRVFELYADVRHEPEPLRGWQHWRAIRDELFRTHPQTPLPAGARETFGGIAYFDHRPDLRVLAEVVPAEPERREIATSGEAPYSFTRFAHAHFEIGGDPNQLELYWLDGYGGGMFCSFTDATSGSDTYGGGRYLLDTVKGSDLGMADDRLVLDFNFAYFPSCAYDPRWVCPLAPPANRLPVAIRAGERNEQH